MKRSIDYFVHSFLIILQRFPRLLLILFLSWLYLLVFRGSPLFLDSTILVDVTRNLVNEHSLALTDVNHDDQPADSRDTALPIKKKTGAGGKKRQAFMRYEGRDGRQYSHYGPGQPFLSVVFMFIGQKLDGFRTAVTPSAESRGKWEKRCVMLLNPLICLIVSLLFFELLLAKGLSISRAFWFSLILGSSTNLVAMSRTFFLHPLCTLLLFSAFIAGDRLNEHRRSMILVTGVFCGYAILTRLTSAVAVIWIGLFLVLSFFSVEESRTGSRWRLLNSLFSFALIVLFYVGIHLYLTTALFGHPFRTGYQSGAVDLFSGNVLEGIRGFLISPGRSLFLYSPPLILSLIAIPLLFKQHRVMMLTITGISISYLILYSRFWLWFGGDCFGPRYLTELIPFLLLTVALWCADMPRRRVLYLTLPLFIAGITVQLAGGISVFTPRAIGVSQHDYLFVLTKSQLWSIVPNLVRGAFDSVIMNWSGEKPVRVLLYLLMLPFSLVVLSVYGRFRERARMPETTGRGESCC